MKHILFLLGIFVTSSLWGQNNKKSAAISIGTEIDALPYLTGGYYGSAWISKNHLRYRAVVTQITTPDFALQDGFTHNKMKVYALIADYFFKPRVDQWWIGAGVEYWDAEIQTDAKLEVAPYQNYVFTLGVGYVWKFYRNFYLNPWAAVHMRVGGDERVAVDDAIFKPTFLTLEGSLKIGWYFNLKK